MKENKKTCEALLEGYFCAMKKGIVLPVILLFFCSCGDDSKSPQQNAAKDEVVSNLKESIRQNPDSAGLRMRLINSLDSLHLYHEAISQADSLIKKDLNNNGLWFTKGQLQESNRDTAGAIKSYLRALAIYPSVEAQLSLANLYAETQNPEALAICTSVKRMRMGRETEADCDFIAGIYYARKRNGTEAIKLFDEAINENYTLMEAYMEKGFVLYESKRYNEALAVFEKATTVNNTYADAYYWKAKCYEATGDKVNALTDYKRALGLDKSIAEAADAIKRLD